jgi:hypothetical protein
MPAVGDLSVPATDPEVTVTTSADGAAFVWWRLGPGADPEPVGDRFAEDDRQTVIAELLDSAGTLANLQVRFFARAVAPFTLVAAGGDGQLGWPGETLEIAPRARVSAGSRPAAGSHVEFEVMSTMDDGTALDEFTGGSIHATTGVVSTELWPGGSRAIRAVVETDVDGVAQVQWRVGTNEQLAVQRLYAHLLDDTGQRTRHYTIFTAHLAIADEIRWRPCDALEPLLPTDITGPFSVQDALGLFCELFVAGAGGRLRWADQPTRPINISSVVDLGDMPTVVIDVPREFDPPPNPVRSSLLEVSVVAQSGPIRQRMILDGPVRIRRVEGQTQVEWSIAPEVIDPLAAMIESSGGEITALVTLRPAVFGRSAFFAEWTGAFRIRG